MNWSKWIRQCHRWLAIVFTGVVVLIFGLLGAGQEPAQWVYFLPLPPLFLLMFSGLYMFFLPYVGRRKGSGRMSGSADVDAKIAALGGWRGETLARLRALIMAADPDVTEAVKWRKAANPLGVPVWERSGIICTGETYRDKVKLTFARGAALDDPTRLFNSSLDGGTRRAIDVREGEEIDGAALKAMVRAAVALNVSKQPKGG